MLQRICQILIFLLPMICQQAQAQIFTPQHPIYIVNGVRMQEAQVKAAGEAIRKYKKTHPEAFDI